ncbi:YggT family protein [Bacillus sp. FJAT-49736]|uniref:YggT family protein n=1 Tax=Bacillus sp. FJAT-49736 TaxID=2833582 RepID=UPI001BC991CF|nr:YggT family protein [Bacillus sp. FJAT-49736]MBS4172441.1 YggT family protein [Bacillus sp. FJAT-49736]
MSLLFNILTSILVYYSYVLIIYIFLSWFNARQTSIGHVLGRICEPYLEPFRRIIPPIGMIDISPIVALFVLRLAGLGLGQLSSWII